MSTKYLLFWLALASTTATAHIFASFSVAPTQVDVSASPEVDHQALRIPVVYTSNPRVEITTTSDASWAEPSIDPQTGDLVVALTTSTLINRSYTATISLAAGDVTDAVFIKATVSPLKIVAMVDDPVRNRVYAVQQDGLELGALVVYDPLAATFVGSITLGRKPSDVAVARDGSEAAIICSADGSIVLIDLESLSVKETITLPSFENWGVSDTFGRVAFGPANTIYYSDCAWAPGLHVLDRTTKQVKQTVTTTWGSYGFGDFAVSPQDNQLFAWAQYGWHAGSGGSAAVRFAIAQDGTLDLTEDSSATISGINRDPLNSPVLVSADGDVVVIKQHAFNAISVSETLRSFTSPIYAMTPEAEIVSTNLAIFEFLTGNQLAELPVSSTVQVITSDYARLVYFDPAATNLRTINLLETIGEELLGRAVAPAHGAIVVAPDELIWSPLPGIDRYQVYLGGDEGAVASATPESNLYLGEVTGSSINLATSFTAGTMYYWRVDAIGATETVKGSVYEFTVSTVAPSLSRVDARTVRGHADFLVSLDLTSEATDASWTIATAADWIHFDQASGTTPATINLSLDASALASGWHQSSITMTTADGDIEIPVRFEVDELHLTVIRSDPQSPHVYAISEPPSTGASRAYLLEIDSAQKKISRVVPAGRTVTDIAIHAGDGRVYVTNWQIGSLLAFDKSTLALERTYAFKPFGGTGYGDGDVYRIAAGGPGRLLVEEEDQWVDISLFDTAAGAVLSKAYVREGGGQYSPGLRYYYHGENNSSGAQLLKYDTLADTLAQIKGVRIDHTSYYGSRIVVVSEEGNRIFWAGGVFDADLVEEWALKDIIYSTSKTGRYAFGRNHIYDVDARKAILGMPATTDVSAFNSTSESLVLQVRDKIRFFKLGDTIEHPAPVLSLGAVVADRVELEWTDESLESSFTVQYRKSSDATWIDVATPSANTTTYSAQGLEEETSYDFRVKAESPGVSSLWSNVVTTKTPIRIPPVPTLSGAWTSSSTVSFSWWASGDFEAITIERRLKESSEWTVVATLTAGSHSSYTDEGLVPETTYAYRAKTSRRSYYSSYSSELEVTTRPLPAPPQIVSHPQSTTRVVGQTVNLSVYAIGENLQYQWFKDGELIAEARNRFLYIRPVQPSHEGIYTVVVSNEAGALTSEPAEVKVVTSSLAGIYFGTIGNDLGRWALIVRPDHSATFIAYLTEPRGMIYVDFVIGENGDFNIPVQFTPQSTSNGSVVAASVAPDGIQGVVSNGVVAGILNGSDITFAGASEPTTGTTSSMAGLYTSSGVGRAAGTLYSIVGTNGNVLVITATATGSVDGGMGTLSPQGTTAITTVDQASIVATVNSAMSSVVATVTTPTSEDTFASVLPKELRNDRLMNISSRGVSGSGDNVMIGGFVVGGSTPRTMLIRGAGPALSAFGVKGASSDCALQLYDAQGNVVYGNDDWESSSNLDDIAQACTLVGGFPFDAGSKDAAMLVELLPGAYTAITSGKDGSSGVVLTEVYDVTAASEGTSGVVNLSIRAHVGQGDDVVIAGFVVEGNSPKRVLVRAVGPTLTTAGLKAEDVLANPKLIIIQEGDVVVENDDWDATDTDLVQAAVDTGALPLIDGSTDSAMLLTLLPGVYTAQTAGVSGETGIVLVEIYQLD